MRNAAMLAILFSGLWVGCQGDVLLVGDDPTNQGEDPFETDSEEDSAYGTLPEAAVDTSRGQATAEDTVEDTVEDSGETDSTPSGAKLVFAEEFDQDGLPSTDNWSYDVGGHGWGNGESQYYTDSRLDNARVEDGVLIIEARKEDYEGSAYTSARLVSKEKADFLYGRIEVRALLPRGRGTWPAIWMLPTDWTYGGWPDSGEIDIMEHVGFDPGVIHGTVHTRAYYHTIGTQRGGSLNVADAMDAMHVYAIEWQKERIDFFVDGELYFSFANEHTDYTTWPFDQRFHFVLNIAVGGSWGGAHGIDDTVFPQKMLIDWIHVYEL